MYLKGTKKSIMNINKGILLDKNTIDSLNADVGCDTGDYFDDQKNIDIINMFNKNKYASLITPSGQDYTQTNDFNNLMPMNINNNHLHV